MHVWSHLRDRCGVDLPLRALFEHPTVAALARVVDEAPRVQAGLPDVKVTARRRTVRAVQVAPVMEDADPGEVPGLRGQPTAVAAEAAAGGEG
jgi:hypothetical protein